MPLSPDRRLQLRIACALALVIGVNAVVLSVLAWGVHRGLSASGHAIQFDLGLPATVGAVLLGAIGLVAVQARYGSKRVVADLETEPIEGDGPRDVGARVRRLAKQADVPVPPVAVADRDEPNCLTIGTQRSPTVVITTGSLKQLDDDELDAVLAHEIAHLANRDLTVVSAVAAIVAIGDRLLERERTLREFLVSIIVVAFYAIAAFWIILLLAAPFLVIATLFIFVSAVARLLLAVNAITIGLFAKTREHAADRGASELTGDPAALASALETLSGDDRPNRDARLDASATLGIVPQSLSVDRSDDGDEEGWFDRWFVSQFSALRENISNYSANEEDSATPEWRDQESTTAEWREPDYSADDEPKSWIVEPFVESLVSPVRNRVRRLLSWRPATHPTTEARIEQLQTLEWRRRN
ncbi:M48 family metallopeptidase [Natrarchaeobaculum aegyptiacum]|uniref:Peptidase M48 n=1 Tax=Natrarchaeobaculum aegyptiacum TaxID=745377 RepID=A0A2Z2HV32_9EURY|nr:M48 family metalloprotease [Natrarchaeobaculum aegyptiacum]ARS90633.1 peptidase M48 [Natrarchaeobaculum aegyptiacum]